MTHGKINISAGLLFMAGFMVFGFVLIYLRDFAPGKEQWIADYTIGKHFESRLSHVHGNLFAFLNIVVGYLLLRLPFQKLTIKWVSWLALVGMLMPVGILTEVLLGAPPIFVLIGATSMIVSVAWLGIAVARLNMLTTGDDAKVPPLN
ncbi:MAG: hypothetical protein GZ085_07840 [Sulfuriferula multivorans]|uniref:Uncharacterized protein n=1 Tax=Sulfuriferula multivorans TaxID=1559896 RepID=A0A7C9K301_9PROT|nr:hypothetical protein [Sulfuriferula multivorans]